MNGLNKNKNHLKNNNNNEMIWIRIRKTRITGIEKTSENLKSVRAKKDIKKNKNTKHKKGQQRQVKT